MNDSHIYGHTVHKRAFGLEHLGEIVSVVTLRVPRQKTHRAQGLVEIARFASCLDTFVVGGFQRLLPHIVRWAEEMGFKGIISYADMDTGSGNVYLLAGFDLAGETGPSYWYTNGVDRFDRFRYRAKPGKSERDVAKESGVYRIYGAGSKILTLTFKEQHSAARRV